MRIVRFGFSLRRWRGWVFGDRFCGDGTVIVVNAVD